MWKAIPALLLLSGCMTIEERRALDEAYLLRFYSRADVDAINAQAACKAQARNLVQVARCETRR
jgi:hypothetical protein